MTIHEFIRCHSIVPPQEFHITHPPWPYRLGIEGLIPSFMGQNKAANISVALFAMQGRFTVINTNPRQRFEGQIDLDYAALGVIQTHL